ncbi:unnamed protein product [Rotaria socialis]|uniref:Uncharacterized protein n=1 Tax=Rotaria socialis TaxID=392032 RepID=A0A821G3I1_9BILA|nr:unnamed protein product [Rotaria socialis]
MATNGGEEETVRKLIEKQLDEKETTNQVMKRLQDELAKIKSEAEEIELIEETKCQDELEKLKGELEKVTQIKRRQIREAGEKERKQLELEFASSIKRSRNAFTFHDYSYDIDVPDN